MKKPSKVIAIISAIAITGTLGVTTFAASNTGNLSNIKSTINSTFKKAPAKLTDEQKAQMIAKMKEKLSQQLADGKITQDQYDKILANLESGKMPMRGDKGQKPNADQIAKMKAIKDKWDALTDEQKEEVYTISEQQIDLQIQMIDKYVALGLLDQDKATNMKANLEKQKANIREGGKMPLGFGMGGIERRGFGGGQKPPVSDDTTNTTPTAPTTAE